MEARKIFFMKTTTILPIALIAFGPSISANAYFHIFILLVLSNDGYCTTHHYHHRIRIYVPQSIQPHNDISRYSQQAGAISDNTVYPRN